MTVTTRRLAVLGGAALALSACTAKYPGYTGPAVTRLQLFKRERTLFVFHDRTPLKAYRFDLGFAPEGPKQFEGDGKTPEGTYLIDRRNPNSLFYLSLGISYPNARDVAYAASQGQDPGGDIFIHGGPRVGIDPAKPDWTAGCIAVTDPEIRELYAMVQVGTPVDIFA